MDKKVLTWNIEIQGHKFTFECEADAHVSSVKEALYQFTKHLAKVEDEILAKLAEKKEEDQ